MSGSGSRSRVVAWPAAAMVVGLLAVTASPPASAAGPAPDQDQGGRLHAVTLVTGDRVLLDGDRLASVTPGDGRGGTSFQTFQRDGHVHVVPRDAVRPLAEGRLDPRLFDVTGLVEAGYDDARRDDVPLIVTRAGDRSPQVSTLRITRDLATVRAVAAVAPKATAAAGWSSLLADPGAAKVWLDGVRQPTLDRSTAQIGAPAAWAAGYTGAGVTVAVVDTGVDGNHPDLAGREVAEHNFTADPDAADLIGHGTHVGATIASHGARYRGVAPDVRLLDAKVCGESDGCRESSILEGMRWSAEQGADVVNMSLGGTDTEEVDLLEEAVDALSARHGTLFVISAGNSGSGAETVGSPASADAALAVGAVERNDGIAPFSSRGPRVGDGAVKPEITAPGVDIVAAKSADGVIGTPVGDRHVALSGTSMAAPHVAGAAAVLAQQHPEWTGAQLKAALMASAKPNPALTAFDQGAGRVDLAEAITTTLTTEPASLSFGLHKWPHDDDVPVSNDLAYRNTGTSPITLDLRVEASGPDGEPTRVFSVVPPPSRCRRAARRR
ncbi:subtilisin family serine protease [Saccharothrix ecbatanensis]|uniref:Subtilisin family serine protease n=1 Tax=Saccharothrix ecbatanensis TaxID=1105145 RepID=A0A7W9HGT8_9PSEU|nr:S8 family serine peptidase [Saccharothrix ecbatanensis]MBB5801699.1 subtilisin family serine protease [Saccharothrix ecbatanensis]